MESYWLIDRPTTGIKVKVISSRVKGRIDKLYVKSSGEYLRNGSPIYETPLNSEWQKLEQKINISRK